MNESLPQALLALLQERSRTASPWASARVIAPALGCTPEQVVAAFRALEAGGAIDVAGDEGDLAGTMARFAGPLVQAMPGPARPAHPDSVAYEFDAFMSYAGEDRVELVAPLFAALDRRGVQVWIDERGGLDPGDTVVREINAGLVKARCGIIVASPDYLAKPYPRAEMEALLHRAILDEARPIYPILHRMTRDQLMAEHPLLAARVYVESFGLTADEIADHLLPIIKPPAPSLRADIPVVSLLQDEYAEKLQKSLQPQGPIGGGAPSDALVEPEGMDAYRPFFELEFRLRADDTRQPVLTWTLRNIGPGLARNIRVFLPGVLEYEVPHALDAGSGDVRSMVMTNRYAYHEYMKPPLQAIVESEDYAGNIYRQYGSVDQLPKETDDWRVSLLYVVPRLGHAYLVPQRIVEIGETDRFRLDEPIGWHNIFDRF